MLSFIFLLSVLVACGAAPPGDDFWPKNVITVPPNCPVGQQWVNGQCRDIWFTFVAEKIYALEEAKKNPDNLWPLNVITVPANCRPGQQWINGACRDVWRQKDIMPVNVVTVPPNCPVGQQYINGECRDIWNRASELLQKLVSSALNTREKRQTEEEIVVDTFNVPADSPNRNIINVPNQCPTGFKPDALGFCRPIFDLVLD